MTPDAQQILIAREMDFYVIEDDDGSSWSLRDGRKTDIYPWRESETEAWQDAPPYLDDLNAIHEAEKVLTKEQGETYAGLLCDAVDKDDSDKGKHAGFALAHATAGQRAECFLRAIKRWEE